MASLLAAGSAGKDAQMSDQQKSVNDSIVELDGADVKEADFHALFDESPTGIAIVHADGTFLRVNGAFCSLVGYSSAELVRRRKTHEITHPDDVDAERYEANRIVAGESDGFQVTKKFLTKRGNSVWATSYVTPVKDKKDVFIHFVAHTTPLPLSEDFYRIETTPSGDAAIRPFYPLARLIKDNWKVVSMVVVTLTGSIGTLGSNYLNMREESIRHQQTIDAQKTQIDSLQRQIDRVSRKAGLGD